MNKKRQIKEHKERNAKIKALWATGKFSQREIGERFGMVQSRVSAIIVGRKFPPYRYCRTCGVRYPYNTKGICVACREKREAGWAKQREETQKRREKERLERENRVRICNACNSGFKGTGRARLCPPCSETTGKYQGREFTRFLVRQRDDFTCQDCKSIRTPEEAQKTGKRMFDVHHLNGLCGKMSRSYDRVQDMNGLVTLCHSCHFNRPEHSMQVRKRKRGRG